MLEFEPNCSEELAEIVSNHIKTMAQKTLPHEFLLDSHGVLITTGGETGMEAIHSALAILDTVEWNAEIAYKQTIFQKLGILDGYYSKGVKIGTIEDLINREPIYNQIVKATAGGD
nr:hypothetical protein A5881_001686 [Enterococcus termitis]